jgi:transglutaminase-like putative cysteine protease
MSSNSNKKLAATVLCVLLVLVVVIVMESWPQSVVREKNLSRSYRLVYTLEVNSSDSKQINLNWTAPSNATNFQTINLLNYSFSPSWVMTDENNNTLAHFSVNLPVGQILNISMTSLITLNVTQYSDSSSPLQYNTISSIPETYAQPEEYIESDNPLIIELAHNITKDYSDPTNASHAICEWVNKNVNYSGPWSTP